jgi:DNA polymerase III epsilon subunit-like protein
MQVSTTTPTPTTPIPFNGLHPHLVKTIQDAETAGTHFLAPTRPKRRYTPSPPPPPPNFKEFRNILIFDTETTGFTPPGMNPKRPATVNLELVPYITQLSFMVYNTEIEHFTYCFNEYIDIPDDVIISERVTEITGIDRDVLNAKGIPMFYALSVFLQAVKKCDCIVAHNIMFDEKMIRYEMMRYGFCQKGVFDHTYMCCTMKMGQPVCKIPSPRFEGRLKPPKLCELHTFLFGGEEVENLHNAIVDVLVCFRCFVKMAFDKHVSSAVFKQLIDFEIAEEP